MITTREWPAKPVENDTVAAQEGVIGVVFSTREELACISETRNALVNP